MPIPQALCTGKLGTVSSRCMYKYQLFIAMYVSMKACVLLFLAVKKESPVLLCMLLAYAASTCNTTYLSL